MGFNRGKFRSSQWDDRTESVPVPSLGPFFEDGEKPVMVVRGLTKEEVNRAGDVVNKSAMLQTMAAKLAAGNGADAADAVLAYAGVPADSATDSTRLEYQLLKMGIVSPEFELEDIRRWANAAPDEVRAASAAINRCTALGKRLAGSPNSG